MLPIKYALPFILCNTSTQLIETKDINHIGKIDYVQILQPTNAIIMQ